MPAAAASKPRATKTRPALEVAPDPEPQRWPTIYDKLKDRARTARLADERGEYKFHSYPVPGDEMQPHVAEFLDGLKASREQIARDVAQAMAEHDGDMPERFERVHGPLNEWAKSLPRVTAPDSVPQELAAEA